MNHSTLRQATCVLIKNQDNKFLTVTRRDGYGIGLPGGKVDHGESFQQAAIRELQEETSIKVSESDLIPIYRGICYDHRSIITECFDVLAFLAVNWQGTPIQKEPMVKPLWNDYEELLNNSPFKAYNSLVYEELNKRLASVFS